MIWQRYFYQNTCSKMLIGGGESTYLIITTTRKLGDAQGQNLSINSKNLVLHRLLLILKE